MPVTEAEIAGLRGAKGPKGDGVLKKNVTSPPVRQLIPPISIPKRIPVKGDIIQPNVRVDPGIPRIGLSGIKSAKAFKAAKTEM
jgi:hypothetical protein